MYHIENNVQKKRLTKYRDDIKEFKGMNIGDSILLNIGYREKESLRVILYKYVPEMKFSFYKQLDGTYRMWRDA